MPSALDGNARIAERKMQLGVRLQEPLRDLNQTGSRSGYLKILQHRLQQFVDQYPTVLRVIAEFHHVPMTVFGFQQVSLGASPHLSYVPDGCMRHLKAVT